MKRIQHLLCLSLLPTVIACETLPAPKVENPEPSELKDPEAEVPRLPTPEELQAAVVTNRAINTIAKSRSVSERMGLQKGQKTKTVTVQMNGIDFTFEDRNGLAVIDDVILGETKRLFY